MLKTSAVNTKLIPLLEQEAKRGKKRDRETETEQQKDRERGGERHKQKERER